MGSGEESVPPPPSDETKSGSGEGPENPDAQKAAESGSSAPGQGEPESPSGSGGDEGGPGGEADHGGGDGDESDDEGVNADHDRPETRDYEPTQRLALPLAEDEDPADDEEIEERPVPTSQKAPQLVSLDEVDEDATFRIRPEGELSLLATDIARLGQLFAIDLRARPDGRYQVIAGFRRVAALRFLQRDRVLARVHTDLSDEDALLMALAQAIHHVPVSKEELSALKDRLEGDGQLTAATRDMLEKALSEGEALSPENVEEEIDADELASDDSARLGEINQDLSLLADVFGSLDEARRAELLTQLRYSAQLVAFLEGQ